MIMIIYGVSILIMGLIFTKRKYQQRESNPARLVPDSLRLLELISSFVIINHVLVIYIYSIIMTDIFAYICHCSIAS